MRLETIYGDERLYLRRYKNFLSLRMEVDRVIGVVSLRQVGNFLFSSFGTSQMWTVLIIAISFNLEAIEGSDFNYVKLPVYGHTSRR